MTQRDIVLGTATVAVCAVALVIAVVFDAPTSTNLLLIIVFLGAGVSAYYGTRGAH